MKYLHRPLKTLFFVGIISFFFISANGQSSLSRNIIPLDTDWKFFLPGLLDTADASSVELADSAWRTLNLPHDWTIEGPYNNAFPSGSGGGYLPTGLGWYRKYFSLGDSDSSKRIFIEFDGVMANSDVWINGYHLGKRPNGYVGFEYELTGKLKFGLTQTNVIAVKVDNSIQPSSRFYTGSGIYRHVRLKVINPLHIAHWGSFISTSGVSSEKAVVKIETTICNQSNKDQTVQVQTSILSPQGKRVAFVESELRIQANQQQSILQKSELTKPMLWDLESPQLYMAFTTINAGQGNQDEMSTQFGIRESKFDAATGYSLNGKNFKIKGVCLHMDAGALGVAVPAAAWRKRLTLLKELGVNAIRTSHNPVSPDFLDLCDQMGFLVLEETFDAWEAPKISAPKGYNLYFKDWWQKDTHDMVVRDRNHPSLIVYSVGNEIRENLNDSSGFRKYKMQQDLVHSLDPTRPVTMALFRPEVSNVYKNGLADMMDLIGQNYREDELVKAHENKPTRILMGLENSHSKQAWITLRDNPFIAGEFLWTGVDYLGEGNWPRIGYGSGLLDKTAEKKDLAFQRQSWWTEKPVLQVMRNVSTTIAGEWGWINDWSPIDRKSYKEATVQVFSNCDEVELFLRNKSLGSQMRPEDNVSSRIWNVNFKPGTLRAVAKNKGVMVAEQLLTTADVPSKIVLKTDKGTIQNTWEDLVYVTAEIVDKNGIPCLNANNIINFKIEGPGVIAAVDNADLFCSESYRGNSRSAYKGRCIAIIRANAPKGEITITASTDGLEGSTTSVDVKD